MRSLAPLVACALLAAAPASAGDTRFGLAAGLLVPVDLRVDDREPEADPGPLLMITFDQRVDPSVDVGFFITAGSITAETRDEQVNLIELGVGAHYVRPLAGGVLRLGGGLGYRRLFADASLYDRVIGLAVDADAEYSHALGGGLVGQLEVGVLSQPWGGNGTNTVVWAPIPYATIGAVF